MSCEDHLEKVHGIEFPLMRSLLLENYGDQLDHVGSYYPWLGLKSIAEAHGVETCVVIRSCIAKYLNSGVFISTFEREKIAKLLSQTEAEVYEEEREQERKIRQERADFLGTVNQICVDRFDLLEVELFMLVRNFTHRFSNFSPYGTFGDFAIKNLRSPSVDFDLAVLRSIQDREQAVHNSVSGSNEPILTRITFLVPDVETHIEANKILNIACRYGESDHFAELDSKGRGIPERRRDFLISIVQNSTEFRKFFLSLWYSSRCRDAAPEFAKRAGQSWDRALKY
jgi:hypothetical protein